MENIKLIIDRLVSSKVRNSFGIPGGGQSLNLIDEFEKNSIDFHLTKFEGSAVIMAATTGYLNNEIGVSISIKGPGLVNSLPGIALSHFESFPLVHFTEAYDHNSSESLAHKRINQKKLCESIVKKDDYINSTSILSVIDLAKEEEPGPVLIQLSNGIEEKKAGNISEKSINHFFNFNVEEKILDNVKKPIIIVGALANRKLINNLISGLTIPIFTTVAAKGFVDESSEYSAGIYTGVGLSLTPEFELIRQSDFIICIGLNAKEILSVKPFSARAINFDLKVALGADSFNFQALYHLDSFGQIIHKLGKFDWGRVELLKIKKRLLEFSTNSFLPGQVFQLINEKYINISRVIVDTGNFCTISEHIIQSRNSKNVLMSSNSRFMGTSLPMGIASSIYDNSFKTIVFVGDGGIGMFLAEIDLAVKLKLPLIIVLLSDGSFASIRARSISNSLTDKPLIMNRDSWGKTFEGFQIPSVRVENLIQFDREMSNAFFVEGPVFIEVHFNQSQYLNMTNNIR
ncbi:thiamine pyrophosphate-binding protein [Aquirufa antheringensis]